MGSRDRPGREVKKKPKAKDQKPRLESLLQAPPQSVEIIKPKRKPRHDKDSETEEE